MSMDSPFALVPPADPRCRATVVIPARNEAAHIGRTLAALIDQRDVDGARLPAGTFDVLVYANNCSDRTAAVVRALACREQHVPIFIAEETLPPKVAHIGTARRAAMHAGSARLRATGTREGILCATDADTIPAPTWMAWTLREMARVDAVTGRILIDRSEFLALPAATQTMLLEEHAYHFAISRLRACVDPQPHDPWPRHWQRSGPSFAVRVEAYDAVGGIPPVRALEDVALYDALIAAGRRIRHSLRVRVTTSARTNSRAPGGFGERITAWTSTGEHRRMLVEDPRLTLARLLGEPVAPPELQTPCFTAPEAIAAIDQMTARGVSAARATRNNVASIAG